MPNGRRPRSTSITTWRWAATNSVPHQLVGKKLNILYTERTEECFHKGQLVASHRRILGQNGLTTLAEHMPRSHQEHAKWTPKKSPTGYTRSAKPQPSWPRGS
ncbi:hypothetical protein DFAR_3200007 [Desulfarculales bacterium]